MTTRIDKEKLDVFGTTIANNLPPEVILLGFEAILLNPVTQIQCPVEVSLVELDLNSIKQMHMFTKVKLESALIDMREKANE